ncbi:MAG: hydroxylysine kinase [Lysobacterales bacterium]|jgi:hydroxylysine kinase
MQTDQNDLLQNQPPSFTVNEATAIALEHYAVKADASSLWSERDQNFRLLTHSGDQFVLKIANSLESVGVIDFQTRALEHIAKNDPHLPVPRTIVTVNGGDYCSIHDAQGRSHMVRLISWLDGEIIDEMRIGPELLCEAGRLLAKLGIALCGFSHPAANHHLIWDLKNSGDLIDLLPNVDEAELRELLEEALSLFQHRVLPVIGNLRAQIIHADLNRGNILISDDESQKITGIIDFGDMVHTPLIMDPAIAAAYHLSESGDPLGQSLHLIGGYHEVTPLEPVEAEILLDLMIARLCTSIIVSAWRVKLYPENSEYLLIHEQQTIAALKHAMTSDLEESRGRIMHLCGHA